MIGDYSITERSVKNRVYPIGEMIAAKNDLQKRSYQNMSEDKEKVTKIKLKFLEALIGARSKDNYI